MLKSYILPKKLKTTFKPGRMVHVWIDEKLISSITEVETTHKQFLYNFINNLENMGWNVIMDR